MWFFKKKRATKTMETEICCPYCFERFNVNMVHFRSQAENAVEVEDELFKRNYIQAFNAVGSVIKKPVLIPGKDGCAAVCNDNGVYVQCNCPDNTPSTKRLCPNCHNEIKDIGLSGPNRVISVLGYTQIGKTHFITSLLDFLYSIAPQIGPKDLCCQFLSGEALFKENREKYKKGPLEANDVQYIEPIIIELIVNCKSVYISFYDFPGEAGDDYLETSSARHIRNADAYMLLFDMTKTATFWEKAKRQELEWISDDYKKIDSILKINELSKTFIKHAVRDLFSRNFITGSSSVSNDLINNLQDRCVDIDVLRGCTSNNNEEIYNYLNKIIGMDKISDGNKGLCKALGDAIDIVSEMLIKATAGFFSENPKETPFYLKDVINKLKPLFDRNNEEDDFVSQQREQQYTIIYLFMLKLYDYERERVSHIKGNSRNLQKMIRNINIECDDANLRNHSLVSGEVITAYLMFNEWLSNRFFPYAIGVKNSEARPLAIVGTKSDCIHSLLKGELDKLEIKTDDDLLKKQDLLGKLSFIHGDDMDNTTSYYNEVACINIDTLVRELLFTKGLDGALDTLLNSRGFESDNRLLKFSKIRYFAVSALGTRHVIDDDGTSRTLENVNSWRVAEPLFWLLHSLELLD